jgi:hypothetical protein
MIEQGELEAGIAQRVLDRPGQPPVTPGRVRGCRMYGFHMI